MAYIRSKKVKGNTYYYVVEGKLGKEGKVKQTVLLYLGSVENVLKCSNSTKQITTPIEYPCKVRC